MLDLTTRFPFGRQLTVTSKLPDLAYAGHLQIYGIYCDFVNLHPFTCIFSIVLNLFEHFRIEGGIGGPSAGFWAIKLARRCIWRWWGIWRTDAPHIARREGDGARAFVCFLFQVTHVSFVGAVLVVPSLRTQVCPSFSVAPGAL